MATFANNDDKLTRLEAATYTVKDIAQLIKSSERHVHRLHEKRTIPGAIKFGRLLRFSRAIVDDWLANADQLPPQL